MFTDYVDRGEQFREAVDGRLVKVSARSELRSSTVEGRKERSTVIRSDAAARSRPLGTQAVFGL